MDIASFADLLEAARAQPEPQRLLFVFAGSGLPAKSTAEQRRRHAAGEGGELTPVMAADKTPEELPDFAALERESRQFGPDWSIVFVSSLSGRAGRQPADPEIEAALQRMVEAVKAGRIAGFATFDRRGTPVRLTPH